MRLGGAVQGGAVTPVVAQPVVVAVVVLDHADAPFGHAPDPEMKILAEIYIFGKTDAVLVEKILAVQILAIHAGDLHERPVLQALRSLNRVIVVLGEDPGMPRPDRIGPMGFQATSGEAPARHDVQ